MTDAELSGSISAEAGLPRRTPIRLEGELTVFTVGEQKERLLAEFPAHSRLEVDLSGITELDTAGLQLLIAFEAEARHQGVPLEWKSPSQAVVGALEISRLRGTFDEGTLLPRRPIAPEAE